MKADYQQTETVQTHSVHWNCMLKLENMQHEGKYNINIKYNINVRQESYQRPQNNHNADNSARSLSSNSKSAQGFALLLYHQQHLHSAYKFLKFSDYC